MLLPSLHSAKKQKDWRCLSHPNHHLFSCVYLRACVCVYLGQCFLILSFLNQDTFLHLQNVIIYMTNSNCFSYKQSSQAYEISEKCEKCLLQFLKVQDDVLNHFFLLINTKTPNNLVHYCINQKKNRNFLTIKKLGSVNVWYFCYKKAPKQLINYKYFYQIILRIVKY